MRFSVPAFILFTTLAASAQRGDKKDHENMDAVVPVALVPPSPVLEIGEAMKAFQIAPGFVIEPVAVEPLVDKPVCLDFDPAGRMWVCEMRGYMPDIDGKGEVTPEGRIVILADSNGDGQADRRTVFMDKIMMPRAISVFADGVLFLDSTRLCWVKRAGDKPAGEPVVIDTKLASTGNVEHKLNGLLPNLDNRYYLAKSDMRLRRDGDRWEFESTAFRGQWGIARDDYGRLYHNTNSRILYGDLLAPNLLTGNPGVKMKTKDFIQLGGDLVWPARVTPGVNRAYMAKANGYDSDTLDPNTYKLKSTTAAAGMAIYRGTNFPEEWYGTGFVCESVAALVKAVRIGEKDGILSGSHPLGEKEFLTSTDERFRPVNVYNAPDGSLYLLDMYHGIIQHRTFMTSYLRTQTLERGLDKPAFGQGRIYRIRSAAGKLLPAPDPASMQGPGLVKLLAHPNSWHRETAQRVLVERKDPATVPDLAKLATAGPAIPRIHAIWALEGMGALEAAHLTAAIRSDNPKLQASALWAGTRLSSPELAKLAPDLIAAIPAGKESVPYLARALGPLGTPEAFAALAKLLEANEKTPFVREAAVSGLDRHEIAFRDSQLKGSSDKMLVAWVEEGAKDLKASASTGPGFKGEQLAAYERGKSLYLGEAACFGCHGTDGAGLPSLGPPLDQSEWVTGKPEILIKILLHGMTGPVTVAGETYSPTADMPGLAMNPAMTDARLSEIATYIRNEWSNKAAPIPVELVRKQREITRDRNGRSWTAGELK